MNDAVEIAKPNSNNDTVIEVNKLDKNITIEICAFCSEIKSECICKCFCNADPCYCADFIAEAKHEVTIKPKYKNNKYGRIYEVKNEDEYEVKNEDEYEVKRTKSYRSTETGIEIQDNNEVKEKCHHCDLHITNCICECSACGRKDNKDNTLYNFYGILFCQTTCFRDLCTTCMKTKCICQCVTCGGKNQVRLSEGQLFCCLCIRCSICKIGDRQTNNGKWSHPQKKNFICGNCKLS